MTAFDRLIKLAQVATAVGLKDCTYQVSVAHSESGTNLGISVHRPPEEFIVEAREKHGAVTEGWRDCAASGSPENVFRSWEFSPEEGMNFIIFERAPEGKLLEDTPECERAGFKEEEEAA